MELKAVDVVFVLLNDGDRIVKGECSSFFKLAFRAPLGQNKGIASTKSIKEPHTSNSLRLQQKQN
ncbi:hypothetical protein C5167_019879 [Papaver somniferum]|uniref:Uncharacterized protein n=1 Tax=Papaver somniferum TaxID=3469 RepID=A0A4Y7ITH7_PAPSO|nr:hypothetical protein C5167_019879 [Papaver somniferum]